MTASLKKLRDCSQTLRLYLTLNGLLIYCDLQIQVFVSEYKNKNQKIDPQTRMSKIKYNFLFIQGSDDNIPY